MLSDNIRFARMSCGYTQQQMADYLGIKRSSYTYYETGHTPFPIELLPLLTVAFGVSTEWLLSAKINFSSGDDTLPSVADSRLPGLAKLTEEERELLLMLRKHNITTQVTQQVREMTGEKSVEE
ncbi:MAG: helix-turn-helix transcriptional regulator [Clostridia bacterium]|nr:helix-turn-helix transcriptional regulator [Clostridia bacterium]MBR2414165.1 helix-turn-helix transcriptional regulator [Clostridia bacterium]